MKDVSNINVLINAFGIIDSGGARVLEKLLKELSANPSYQCHIVCNRSRSLEHLISKYNIYTNVHFITLPKHGLWYRFYYENFTFRRIVSKKNIRLIYNFSGSHQFFIKIPQLVKVQNLLFYSKKLDFSYQHQALFLWIKHVFKRSLFRLMLNKSKHIEIQSSHVKSYLIDFIDTQEKAFYLKSDIEISNVVFQAPKQYDFSNKINFLYVVGPHFELIHKNLIDFTSAMLVMNDKDIDFAINITLTHEQLKNSKVWNASLNSKTNFLGYISNQEKMSQLFCDNTILISTSVIETLGLHVIEGIKNGILTIAPDEKYANSVYGKNMFKYELFNKDSLVRAIMSAVNYKKSYSEKILSIQDDLRQSEMSKFDSILNVFDEVLNVQK
jgi:hypothetical protein